MSDQYTTPSLNGTHLDIDICVGMAVMFSHWNVFFPCGIHLEEATTKEMMAVIHASDCASVHL